MRERLIELIRASGCVETWDYCTDDFKKPNPIYELADHLLANGVIVPPVKVGDTVWFNTYKRNATVCIGVQPHKVDRIDTVLVCDDKALVSTRIYDWEIGKTVFLTREEAEAALQKGAEK